MLCFLNLFCSSNISRILSGKSKLSQSKRIGTVGGSLTGRDQLVGSSYRIVNFGNNLQNQILCKCRHLRPVFDVRSKLDLNRRISHAFAVKYTVIVNRFIKEIFLSSVLSCEILSRGKESLVCSCSSDRTGIHKCNRRNLTILDLGAFTVREVSGGMADTESIVCRSISSTEAWTAECSFHNSTCLKKICQNSILSQFHINRSTCRIYA